MDNVLERESYELLALRKILRTALTRVRPQLKMAQPSNWLSGARLLNTNYLWFFTEGPTRLSLQCENSENYLAND
jgi:hypothetical protein